MQKFKPPVSQWNVDERKRHGWKVDELSRRLLDMGYEAQPSTVQVWEAGRSPKADTIEALERLFGSAAPRGAELSGDLADAIREQAAAIRDLVTAIREDRERISPAGLRLFLEQLAAEGLLLVPGRPASKAESRQRVEAKR
jgi:transcriptional regulator with XRE-family HTH domain